MARNKLATKTVDETAKTVTFTFADQTKQVVNLQDMNESIINRLALHGLAQKLGDSYAGDSTVAEAKADIKDVLDQLLSGDWGREREAGEGTLFVEAVRRFREAGTADKPGKPTTPEEAFALVSSMSDEVKTALRKNATVKEIIAKIQAERAAERAKTATTDTNLAAALGLE